jgi:flagellar protein FliJ
MPKVSGIQLAIDLATQQRDGLAKDLAKVQRALRFSQAQMAQLQGYAQETDGRWMANATRALTPELLRHHFQFMNRLQQAIGLQDDAIAQVLQQLQQAQQALLQAEFRLSGLKQVVKARQATERRRQSRAEQRETDEFAALRHARNRPQLLRGEPS